MNGSPENNVLALVGAGGMLGSMVRRCLAHSFHVELLDLPDFDLTDRTRVLEVMSGLRPRVIINCAGFTDVDGCESREREATLVNGFGPGNLAAAALETGATLVHISTDYVFDGQKGEPYSEDDTPHPMSAYGRSKLKGEREILASGLERFYIVRTSWLFGPGGRNFVKTILRLAREREELRIVADQVGCPTFTEDLAEGMVRLLAGGRFGTYHFANEGSCSWFDFAVEIVRQARSRGEELKVQKILSIGTEDYPLPARRPAFSVLATDKYRQVTKTEIPFWSDALQRYLASVE